MRPLHSIALPAVCVGAYFLSSGIVRQQQLMPISDSPRDGTLVVGIKSTEVAAKNASSNSWSEISQLPPTPQNQWKALEFFKEWAQRDGLGAISHLSLPAQATSNLWPKKRQALQQFYLMWASIGPDQAWKQAQESGDSLAINAVASVLAASDPQKILAWTPPPQPETSVAPDPFAPPTPAVVDAAETDDSTTERPRSGVDPAHSSNLASILDPAVLLLAQRSLPLQDLDLVEDSASRELLVAHAVLSQPLGQLDAILDQQKVGFPEGVALRLIDRSREEMRKLLESKISIESEEDPLFNRYGFISKEYLRSLPSADVAEAFSLQGKIFGWGSDRHIFNGEQLHALPHFESMAQLWDTASLAQAVEKFIPPSSGASPNQLGCWIACVDELMERDPAALLPALAKVPADFGFSKFRDFEDAWFWIPSTPENAAAARALIEVAPFALKRRFIDASYAPLLEYELPFLADQLKLQDRSQDDDEPGLFSGVSVSDLLLKWLVKAPEEATKFIDLYPKSIEASDVLVASAKWVGEDPESASRWLTTLPPSERKDAAITGMLNTLTWHDPASCLIWSNQLSDSTARQDAQRKILNTWRIYDPSRADAAAATLPK